jgi:hypothetical protein
MRMVWQMGSLAKCPTHTMWRGTTAEFEPPNYGAFVRECVYRVVKQGKILAFLFISVGEKVHPGSYNVCMQGRLRRMKVDLGAQADLMLKVHA